MISLRHALQPFDTPWCYALNQLKLQKVLRNSLKPIPWHAIKPLRNPLWNFRDSWARLQTPQKPPWKHFESFLKPPEITENPHKTALNPACLYISVYAIITWKCPNPHEIPPEPSWKPLKSLDMPWNFPDTFMKPPKPLRNSSETTMKLEKLNLIHV